MTLLYILTLVLLCIALAYLFKVIDLSRALKSEKEWVPTENDNRTMGKFFLLFMFLFIVWSFYQVYQYGYRSLPKSASEHGHKVDELMRYNMYIIWIVFVIVNFVESKATIKKNAPINYPPPHKTMFQDRAKKH